MSCNVFIGHNSMVGHNLNFEAITETRLDNNYKIIATDMSDISGQDKSMMLYDLDKGIYYIAYRGNINKYEYLDASGYNKLYLTDTLERYPYLSRSDKRLLKRYNNKNTPITEEEFFHRFLNGKENVFEFL